jgi:flagellar basal body rod protein FlgG
LRHDDRSFQQGYRIKTKGSPQVKIQQEKFFRIKSINTSSTIERDPNCTMATSEKEIWSNLCKHLQLLDECRKQDEGTIAKINKIHSKVIRSGMYANHRMADGVYI